MSKEELRAELLELEVKIQQLINQAELVEEDYPIKTDLENLMHHTQEAIAKLDEQLLPY